MKNRSLAVAFWGVTLAAAAACRNEPAASTPRANEPREESRALCLADAKGDTVVDRELRALQEKALKLKTPPDPWVRVSQQWVRKARLASDPGFYVNVAACARVALELESDFPPALLLRGLALMNDHKFEDARALAERILARDEGDESALGLLSDALLELGRYGEAAAAAQRQMSARPGMAAHARGSYLRWIRGDTRAAKALIRDALVDRDFRDPEPAAWAFVEAGTIFWHEADYAGADALYAEALDWVPDYPAALVGRARVAMAKNEAQRAVDLLEKVYRVRPLPETAWLLGDAFEMLGDTERAREAHARVVRQGRRGDTLTLAAFYATKGRNVDEALSLIEEERKTRGGIYVDDVYAWALYRSGRIAEAEKASARAARIGTKDAKLLYHAGVIRRAAGDEAGGLRLVKEALALNPSFDWTGAAEARAILAETPRRTASK